MKDRLPFFLNQKDGLARSVISVTSHCHFTECFSMRKIDEAYTACLPQTFVRSFTNCEDALIVYIKRYILMLCTVTLHKSLAEYQEVQVEEIALQ